MSHVYTYAPHVYNSWELLSRDCGGADFSSTVAPNPPVFEGAAVHQRRKHHHTATVKSLGHVDTRVVTATDHAATFWRERDEYHDLAREYERHVEITHPNYVTGSLASFSYRSTWEATAVTYYEYDGPDLFRNP